MRVAVIGAAGYAGGELLRILFQHPEATEVRATSRSQAGKPLGDVHPALSHLAESRFSGVTPGEAAKAMDVVFLALEHGESSKIMGEVVDAGPGMIIDLAADFRIHDGRIHEAYYGPHPAPELVHRFTYGLADVVGTGLSGVKLIAAPGCFATAAQLALYPLRSVATVGSPVISAVTGSSGAGSQPKPTTHHPARSSNMFGYSLLGHRHQGEVTEQWQRWTGRSDDPPRLLTHSGPFVRGIYATVYARLAAPSADQVVQMAKHGYADRPFVRILNRPPELTHVVGTNDAALHVAKSDDQREVAVVVAIDNLIKGAGGQAVQAMNLALGFAETTGLRLTPTFPI